MKMLVPRDYVGMGAPVVPANQRIADHRSAAMPDNPYYVGSMRPHLSGEPETDHLFNALYQRLGSPAGCSTSTRSQVRSRASSSAR
jgi:hypothetical protein